MLVKRKKIAAVCTALLLLFSVTGCGGSHKNENIYFELNDLPETLDPQTASTDSELLIVKNLYEGLLRKTADGKIVGGVAEDYTVDGLTYTFHLRKDAHWFTGEDLTAEDFVFGLKRALDPATESPFAERLWAVGGVDAVDPHTLVIRLNDTDEQFPETLTTSVCMPCQEKFFRDAGGKYGLSKEDVLCNGSYYLSKWDRENFGVRLYRNAEYSGKVPAENAAVFFSHSTETTPLERLQKGTVDLAFLSGNDVTAARENGIGIAACEDTCYVLTVGTAFRGDIGNALAMMIDPSVYESQLPPDCRVADSLLPALFDPLGVQKIGRPIGYDPETAKNLFARGIAKVKDQHFPQTTLYYYGDDVKELVTAIVGHWQSGLSAFINIEPVSSIEKLLPQLKSQTLPLTFFPVKANGTSLREYLLQFGVDIHAVTPENAQQNILSGNRIIPIAFGSTSVGYTDVFRNFSIADGTGYVDFAPLIKKG